MQGRKYIDINSDIGEGFGIYKVCEDEKILRYISSANVACGFHAGDPQIMKEIVRLAKKQKVAIGAHISFPDLQGFGRRKIDFSPSEISNIALYQIGALHAIAKSEGLNLQHIKLHGALYHIASDNPQISEAIAEAILNFNRNLWWIGFPNSWQEKIARKFKIKFAPEGFADRKYDKNNNLLPRTKAGSIIKSSQEAAKQAIKMSLNGKIKTICIHSDTTNSVEIAKTVAKSLKSYNFTIKPLSHLYNV